MLTINNRPLLAFRLENAQAELVSRYMVKEYFQQGNQPHTVEVWDHLVELPGADGAATRLTIRVRGGGFVLPQDGKMVSVLVNRRRTKAAFDVDDPKISLGAQHERGVTERKAKAVRDKAEFEAKRIGG